MRPWPWITSFSPIRSPRPFAWRARTSSRAFRDPKRKTPRANNGSPTLSIVPPRLRSLPPSRAYLDPPLSRRSEFAATEPRLLRAAVAAFLDLLNLSTRTLEEFGHVPVA